MNRYICAKPGDIYQINEECTWPCYVGCILITTEVKRWGVQGYIAVPTERDEPPSAVFLRCDWDWLNYIGKATLTRETGEVPRP